MATVETDSRPEYIKNPQFAIDVFQGKLGDSFSPDDVEQLAAPWEETAKTPLVRPWETTRDPETGDRIIKEEFFRRAKQFEKEEQPRNAMDPRLARERLEKLLEMDLTGDDEPADAKVVSSRQRNRNEIHELEEMLGKKKTDFSKPRPTQKSLIATSKKRFAEIQEHTLVSERLAIVKEEKNEYVLNMLLDNDAQEEVRQAALERLHLLEARGE